MTTSPTSRSRFRPRPAHLVLAAVLVLPAACGAADAEADVSSSLHCTMTSSGAVEATGTVTNHSSKASTYWVDVLISVDGTVIDTRTAVAEDVEPGDSVPIEAVLRDAPRGAPSCEITDVLRLKA